MDRALEAWIVWRMMLLTHALGVASASLHQVEIELMSCLSSAVAESLHAPSQSDYKCVIIAIDTKAKVFQQDTSFCQCHSNPSCLSLSPKPALASHAD